MTTEHVYTSSEHVIIVTEQETTIMSDVTTTATQPTTMGTFISTLKLNLNVTLFVIRERLCMIFLTLLYRI